MSKSEGSELELSITFTLDEVLWRWHFQWKREEAPETPVKSYCTAFPLYLKPAWGLLSRKTGCNGGTWWEGRKSLKKHATTEKCFDHTEYMSTRVHEFLMRKGTCFKIATRISRTTLCLWRRSKRTAMRRHLWPRISTRGVYQKIWGMQETPWQHRPITLATTTAQHTSCFGRPWNNGSQCIEHVGIRRDTTNGVSDWHAQKRNCMCSGRALWQDCNASWHAELSATVTTRFSAGSVLTNSHVCWKCMM